ncbi:MAG: right-handed parallel beta-helix repeat-containing protein [Actinomycetota bacterium]|nr:right-handed parallel beta-helix repeat-containing protein [Actinomycetota bacterium]
MRRLRFPTAVALALALVGTFAVGTASARPPVSCGGTITTSTTLTADVGPCSGDGLIVTANGVTLNLNGHRVFGTAAPEAQGDFAGIRLQRVSGVTVKGGTLDHFAAGVMVSEGRGNTVRNLVVRDNISPCQREVHTQSPGLLGDGITVFSSQGNIVEDNVAEHNGPFSGISLVAETDPVSGKLTGALPSANTVRGNTVRDSNTCFGDIGIRVEGPGANHNVVSGNTVSGSFLEGITVNAVLNTDISGFGVTCGDPIAFPDLPPCPKFHPPNPANTDNVIRGNESSGNALGHTRAGISLLAFPFSNNPKRNTIVGNRVERNGGSGIAVLAGTLDDGTRYGATNNSIIGNVSIDNNQDGCTIDTCGGPRYDLIDQSEDRPCDHNQWVGNAYRTAFPACTTVGGRLIPGPSGSAPAPVTAAGLRLVGQSPRFLPRFVG